MWRVRKFFDTLRVAGLVIVARTFGRYLYSGWDDEGTYCLYEWRGNNIRIPTMSKVYEC